VEKEEFKTVMIKGVEFNYNTEKGYEKDGHVYCKECGERLDGNVLEHFGGRKFIFPRQCKCDRLREQKRQEQERINKVGMMKDRCFEFSRSLKKAGFDSVDGKDEEIVKFAKDYVETFDEMMKENIGIILSGPVGTGKTYLAAAIANGIIEKYLYSVKFRSIPEIVRDIEKTGFNEGRNEYLDRVCSARLMVFDDFGIERNTEYAMELLYAIIDTRWKKNLPTIVTTNVPISELRSENVPIQLKRIYSRLLDMCGVTLIIKGEDRRKKNNGRKSDKAMEIIKKHREDI